MFNSQGTKVYAHQHDVIGRREFLFSISSDERVVQDVMVRYADGGIEYYYDVVMPGEKAGMTNSILETVNGDLIHLVDARAFKAI